MRKMLECVLIMLRIPFVVFIDRHVIQTVIVRYRHHKIVLHPAATLKNKEGFHGMMRKRLVRLYAILQVAQLLPGHRF